MFIKLYPTTLSNEWIAEYYSAGMRLKNPFIIQGALYMAYLVNDPDLDCLLSEIDLAYAIEIPPQDRPHNLLTSIVGYISLFDATIYSPNADSSIDFDDSRPDCMDILREEDLYD